MTINSMGSVKQNSRSRLFRNLAVFSIVVLACVLFYFSFKGCSGIPNYTMPPQSVSSILPEVEATVYQGEQLTPIAKQGNNAILGTQYIDREKYRLEVTGLVDNDLLLKYDDLLALPSVAEVVYMPCVEGWGFTAKWTGFKLTDLFDKAKVRPEATWVMFYCVDGDSTGLPLSYIRDNDIIAAYGLNDMTLPADRGFPFQIVAVNKYGYKWAKWVDKIELMDHEERGYWESRGYSNKGDVSGPKLGD